MAPFDRRDFSGNSVPTQTTGTIGTGDLTINIAANTGWPDGDVGPFIVTIDQGLATEEKVEIASRTGLVLTATATGRGHDNTAAVGHSAGAKIEHTVAARDLAEANQHIADDTQDHHSQYLNTTRHAAIAHAIDSSQIVDLSVGYADLAPGQRWEPGDFKWSMQTADHTGWLKMDGRNTFARVGAYAPLFAVVGITLGAGVDGTTFGIGDVSKKLIMGKAASGGGSTLGGTGGSADAVVVTHSHTVNSHSHSGATGAEAGHVHNANHGHTASADNPGDHVHHSPGNNYVFERGLAEAQRIPDAGSTSNGVYVTYSPNTLSAGAHTHGVTVNANNFNTGPGSSHTHTVGAEAPATNAVGQTATDANLPPFLVMNGFIHV